MQKPGIAIVFGDFFLKNKNKAEAERFCETLPHAPLKKLQKILKSGFCVDAQFSLCRMFYVRLCLTLRLRNFFEKSFLKIFKKLKKVQFHVAT